MSKSRSDLLQGTLELLILKILSLEPMHGWGISERIHLLSDDVFLVNQGSLYPALGRLEDRGFIASEWGVSENNRRAKFYNLTQAGVSRLEGENNRWTQMVEAVSNVMDAKTSEA